MNKIKIFYLFMNRTKNEGFFIGSFSFDEAWRFALELVDDSDDLEFAGRYSLEMAESLVDFYEIY